MTTTISRSTPAPASRRRRRRFALPLAVLVLVGALVAGGWAWWHGAITALPVREHCTATALGRTAELDPEQAGNAATIVSATVRRGLPARAATVGIATAIQESKLLNLAGGDRDSIGLFQQRPSQGWGTPAQIRDPVYATNAFYDGLVKVKGWEDMPVTEAAQEVQRSAFPTAYADHEPEARIIASALTGYSPAGLTCVLAAVPERPAQTADAGGLTPRARALSRAAARETGRTAAVVPADPTALRFAVSGKDNTRTAWALAHWAVARAEALDVVSIETDGKQWTRSRSDEGWTATTGAAPAGTVVVRVA
jgi:hypothetical protein